MINTLVIAALVAVPAPLDANGCRLSVLTYQNALTDVSGAIRRYITCVSDSAGKDDCYSEFRRLKSAQDDFETAVNSYKSECDQ